MRYVILSLPYSRSAGVRALYELQKLLIKAGEDSIVINMPFRFEPDDVVILPEPVHHRIVADETPIIRWYLNKPIRGMSYRPDEYRVYFNKEHAGDTDVILHLDTVEPFFFNRNLKREFVAAYAGKGPVVPFLFEEEVTWITQDWPPTRHDMADFLNRCSKIYLFDDLTVLGVEATLCGCEVYLVNNSGLNTSAPPTVYDDINIQMEGFITGTKKWLKEQYHV